MKAKLILFGFACFIVLNSFTAEPTNSIVTEKLKYTKLVEKFYQFKGKSVFFFEKNESISLRIALRQVLDSCSYLGLAKEDYHYKFILSNTEESKYLQDSLFRVSADKVFSDALISLCKDVYNGADMNKWLSYDELSAKFANRDDEHILNGLISISTGNELQYNSIFRAWFRRLSALETRVEE